ncbi:MAG: hypothetical protein KBC96_02850 [Armatimonadetes bacterium]|nr:hypothetical protein [Armatimonadota bacterium]
MHRLVYAFVLSGVLTSGVGQTAQGVRDIYPDTWVGSDALGRTMPGFADVGPVKNDQRRVVGIFYITWHDDGKYGMKSPYSADVSKILARDPSARLDAKHPLWTEGSYHWGEPEAGYFLSKDEYVIRKDMSMLADAGVDVLVMDVTNAVRYWEEWDVVFPVMQKMKAEGNKVPKFCFWAFNGPVVTVVQDLYDRIYKTGKYKDLWFMWDGKPLLLYNNNPSWDSTGSQTGPQEYSKEVKDFFTLRTMWWGYYEWAAKRFVGAEDNWSFGLDMGDPRVSSMKPEERVSLHNGKREEAAVTPGQHPSSLIGKSWTVDKGEPELNDQDLPVRTFVPWLGKWVDHPEGYGIYFQQRFDEALEANPQFLYINDWNEWTAGKYHPAEGQTFDFMRRKSPFFFVDQYNAEFNRAIQPMKGGYTDNYYMQMAQNIRRYKGVRPIPELRGYGAIKIDRDFTDWNQVDVEYRDTIGDTAHRDYNGYGGLHYTNDSGRNDIVACKVAVDSKTVYFYAETNDALTPHTDSNWMLLFIDADRNPGRGWFGYDFLINQSIVDSKTTTIKRYDLGAKSWVEVGKIGYRYKGKTLELAVPREILGLKGLAFSFDFHWCDNPADITDPISLCVNGDSAPNRRFNYRCIWRS